MRAVFDLWGGMFCFSLYPQSGCYVTVQIFDEIWMAYKIFIALYASLKS